MKYTKMLLPLNEEHGTSNPCEKTIQTCSCGIRFLISLNEFLEI